MDDSALCPKVFILILNWNGWKDTIECLESVFRIDYPAYRVIVCDNASEDGSLEHIKSWAEGRLDVAIPMDTPLRHLSFPPVPKPIPYVQYDREQAEKGGDPAVDVPLTLIQTGGNLGFAGGNNVGLRYALARGDFDYVWLLNNDTVVRPGALARMADRMSEKPGAGMCGSTLFYYHEPDKVQLLGGLTHNKWLGISRHIGQYQSATLGTDGRHVERQMAYVAGASMLVSKSFLEDVGLMCEDYFLYGEELDWILRAKGCYALAYAPESLVYHKVGSTTGDSNHRGGEKSIASDYFLIRSRLMITHKFFPCALPTVYLGLALTLSNRARRRQWNRLSLVLRVAWRTLCEALVGVRR